MHKEMGLVTQVFDEEAMGDLVGDIAIGHTRYSTTGSPRLPNAQPMRFEHRQIGPVVLAHNGNLINAGELRAELAADGVEFVSTSDTEVLGRLLVRDRRSHASTPLCGGPCPASKAPTACSS